MQVERGGGADRLSIGTNEQKSMQRIMKKNVCFLAAERQSNIEIYK